MRRFFVPTPIGESREVILSGADAAHIARVLRMQTDEKILLLDDSGWEYRAQITHTSPQRVQTRILGRQMCQAEPRLQLTLAQALLKEHKMDRLVRRLTELGVSGLAPFCAHRSVPQPAPRRWATRLHRWQRISREAVKQCRRGRTPDIYPPCTWQELLDSLKRYDLAILFWENARTPPSAIVKAHPPESIERMCIILGPEGGFDLREIDQCRSLNLPTATLGPRILQADTAALAACTLTQYLWGDMGSATQ